MLAYDRSRLPEVAEDLESSESVISSSRCRSRISGVGRLHPPASIRIAASTGDMIIMGLLERMEKNKADAGTAYNMRRDRKRSSVGHSEPARRLRISREH